MERECYNYSFLLSAFALQEDWACEEGLSIKKNRIKCKY